MGWTIGLPSLKLNNVGFKSKSCGDFQAVAEEALEERKGHDADIDESKAEQNIYKGFRTARELIEYSEKHCAELKDKTGRGIRADAVRMCSTVCKPPAAFMETLPREAQIRFLDDCVEKLGEIVGEENIKSLAYHFDELGAHVHCLWEPMKDGRLCAKEAHNLKFFGRLNKEMPEHLRSRGWDIEDCNAYDAAKEQLKTEQEKAEERRKRGRHSAAFKAEAEKKKNEIELETDKLIDDHNDLVVKYNDLLDRFDELHETYKGLQEDVEKLSDTKGRIADIDALEVKFKGLPGKERVEMTLETWERVKSVAQKDIALENELYNTRTSYNLLYQDNKELKEQFANIAAENKKLRDENKLLRVFRDFAVEHNLLDKVKEWWHKKQLQRQRKQDRDHER